MFCKHKHNAPDFRSYPEIGSVVISKKPAQEKLDYLL